MMSNTGEISCSGVVIPGILYGTAWKKDATADLVELALKSGFRGFDTACQPKHYDEKQVGLGLQAIGKFGLERKDIYLQTKFTPLSSQDPENLPYCKTDPVAQQVMQSFEVSQANLKTDYLDALLLHSPLESHEQTMQAWRALEEISHCGGARLLGITNCYDLDVFKALYSDAKVKPAIVQNRFYKDTNYEIKMREFCTQQGIVFESFWSLTANKTALDSTLLKNLSAEYQKTPAQVFFRYLSQSGIVPLSGTCSELHMKDDLEIFSFSLPEEDMNEINQMLVTGLSV